MRIVLVNNPASDEGHPPLGLAYLAAYARKYSGMELEFKVVDKEKDPLKEIANFRPDVVGVSSVVMLMNNSVRLAEGIKERLPDVPLILGGPHITTHPYRLPRPFDIGVVGEGERTFTELITALANGGIKSAKSGGISGLLYEAEGRTVATPRRPLIENLDEVPIPARELFDMRSYLAPRKIISKKTLHRGTHILASRGCPFACTFCASSKFWERRVRFFSPEYVVAEMQHLIDNYKVNAICIFDDIFIANKDRLRKIVELVKAKGLDKQVVFSCSVRANLVSDETCGLMKDMNVNTVAVGFESGSEKVLRYLKGETVSPEVNHRAATLLKKWGFEVEGLFIVASPHETKDDTIKTLEFIRAHEIDTVQVSFATPFPGTGLWEYAKSKGFVSDEMDWSELNLNFPNNAQELERKKFMCDMTKEEFLQVAELIRAEIAKRNALVRIRLADLGSADLWRRALKHPTLALRHACGLLRAG
jgi:magnesium-protoporphyrin IX monomethyl ester (oxidative) cyclase